jgi:radical SAM superfamily enzyme YgiQ (UPF0313 family)
MGDARVKVKLILPALTEAKSPFWRPIKYSLFPPLGLATLAAYLDPDDEISILDEHVEPLVTNDQPDLVVIQVYITSAYRSYELADLYRARGSFVCLGGLHITSLPEEAALHADAIFVGPGEDIWPAFLADYHKGTPKKVYESRQRSLVKAPYPRRDLLKLQHYLVPNSIVVSRGCPYKCDFCYKSSFFKGGSSFYTQTVERALAEIESLPGRHLYFLDDHLLGNLKFASQLFDGMRGMGRLWQAAGTVQSILTPGLIRKAAEAGLRSLFVGFETLNPNNLREQGKYQNLNRDYAEAIRRLHDLGVMVNASFVFGMDEDDETVFDRTVEWAVRQGIETATFHILTPYPDTPLFVRMQQSGRITTRNWDLYDTRHAVFTPRHMSTLTLEKGYWRSYENFYSWGNIFQSTYLQNDLQSAMRHFAYKSAWKKFEPWWDFIIRLKRVSSFTQFLELLLSRKEIDKSGLRGESAQLALVQPEEIQP